MYEVIGSKASRAFRVLWLLEELGVDYDHTPQGRAAPRRWRRTRRARYRRCGWTGPW